MGESRPTLPRVLPKIADRVRVGTAGWSYPDWEGIVYPSPAPTRFDRLAWMARFTDIVEINATFYRAARRRDAASWVERVGHNPRFRFCAKLERVFTHETQREERSSERVFKDGLAPVAESGRLAALLVQFPYSFRNNRESRERLSRILTRFGEYPLAVELRHRSWITTDILAFLSARGVVLAGIDQPQVGQSVGPSLPLTGSFFYTRFHGRNTANWFRRGAGRDARYDYLYAAEEIGPWIERIGSAARQDVEGIVITNNHYRGQAAVNAVEIRQALAASPVPAPPSLIRTYPRLEKVARPLPEPGGGERRLF